MSWKPVVKVINEGDKWHDNALRFATKEEALQSAGELMMRWMATTDMDAHESDDPVNYAIIDDKMVAVPTQTGD